MTITPTILARHCIAGPDKRVTGWFLASKRTILSKRALDRYAAITLLRNNVRDACRSLKVTVTDDTATRAAMLLLNHITPE